MAEPVRALESPTTEPGQRSPPTLGAAPLSPVLEQPSGEAAPSSPPTPRSPASGADSPDSAHAPAGLHRRCVSDTPAVRLALGDSPDAPGPAAPRTLNGVALEPSALLNAVYLHNGSSPASAHRFLAPNSSFSSLSSLVSIGTEFSVGEVDGASVRSLEAEPGARLQAGLDRGGSEDSGVVVIPVPGDEGKKGRKQTSLTAFLNSALDRFGPAAGKGKPNGVSRCPTAPSSTTGLILHDRPDGLPAKDPKEIKRHQAEYSKLLERIKKGETESKKRAEDEEQRRFQRELRIRTNLDAWRNEILPNLRPQLLRADRQRRNLLWDGVPGPLRDRAWPLMVGNELRITRDDYDRCVAELRSFRAEPGPDKARGSKSCSSCSSSAPRLQQSLNLICSDIVRTFPKLSIFQVDGPQHRDMVEVLGAYAFGYKPDVGYCQGMSFLAAVLLLNLPSPFDAFICLANLLNRPLLRNLYDGDLGEKFQAYRAVFEYYLARVLPDLASHFNTIGLDSRIYLLSWLLTLFSSTLPLECSFRVWDLYLVDGDPFLFRAALGLLRCLQPFLLRQCYDLTAEFLTKMIPDDTLSATKLFQSIRSVSVDSTEFHSLLAEAQRGHGEL